MAFPPEKKKGALIIGITPKDDAPPPLTSPEDSPQEEANEPVGTEECENCRFYAGTELQCKRYPQWVEHQPDHWCGEFVAGKIPAEANEEAPGVNAPHGGPPGMPPPPPRQGFP